jgi:hypothetical protein
LATKPEIMGRGEDKKRHYLKRCNHDELEGSTSSIWIGKAEAMSIGGHEGG